MTSERGHYYGKMSSIANVGVEFGPSVSATWKASWTKGLPVHARGDSWVKIKNCSYSQAEGRREFFESRRAAFATSRDSSDLTELKTNSAE